MFDRVFTQCSIATMQPGKTPYGLINDGAVVIRGGKVDWVGPRSALPKSATSLPHDDLQGRLLTPALIDCHTHLVFAGHRAKEFEMRLNGATYEEIACNGGGILSTVEATRSATDKALLSQSLKRLQHLIDEGVGVVEIKSGYGLTIKDEIRMLKIARHLDSITSATIKTTWLAAHAIPPEYQGNSDGYIDDVVIPGLYEAHTLGLVDAVDGFCEHIGFSVEQIRRVMDVAMSLNLPVKLHAEQLSDQKGALLAAKYHALSADHLEFLQPQDVEVFAASNSVAVLLPGAFYTLNETQLPPIEQFRQHQVSIAIATDCNPGSSPISSLLVAMNMACKTFSLTPEEVLLGVTRHAAKALAVDAQFGEICAGRPAMINIWDVEHPAQLCYWIGRAPLYQRVYPEGIVA